MGKYKVDVSTDENSVSDNEEHSNSQNSDEFSNKMITIGAVVVGAALFEAALIPGIAIGVAAALAPKLIPKLEKGLQPLFSSSIRGIYKIGRKAKSVAGEVKEHMGDIAAEVHAEEIAKASEPSKNIETV